MPILGAWKFFLVIGLPIVLLPLPLLGNSSTANAAFVVLIMAVFWVTEAVPIAMTALLPVVLYPLFGIQDTEILTQQYLKDSVQLFVGGLLVALAFEYCGLHKRIALKVMLFTGTSIGMLLLGIMLTTMFLSMWMFNTATTAMMVPIISSIVDELERSMKELCKSNKENKHTASEHLNINDDIENKNNISISFHKMDGVLNEAYISAHSEISTAHGESVTFQERSLIKESAIEESPDHSLDESIRNLKTMLLLSTCYASNLGGTGVLTGSGTNLVALEFLGDLDPKHHGDHAALTFASWMGFNIFPMLICIFIAWVYLQIVFLGLPNRYRFWKNAAQRKVSNSIFNKEIEDKIESMLIEKYKALGHLTIHEIGVLILFVLVVASWVLHDPKFIPGWGSWFHRKVSISTSSHLIGVLFFIVPRNEEFYRAFKNRDFTGVKFLPLLDYEFTLKKFPWNVVILLGGGYALSNGAKKAGLSSAIGQSLSALHSLPPTMIQLCCMLLIGFVTEVASNTATASIVIPILLELSQELNIHPLYLTLPATTTCSYAFMLPVATPPNAIVYSAGNLKVSDMIKTGLFMNFACIFVLFITTNLYGGIFFNFSTYSYIP